MTYTDSNISFEPHPTIHNFIDRTGQTFGRLTVLGYAGAKSGNSQWFCRCDCGAIRAVAACHLTDEHTQSCGCMRRDTISERPITYRANFAPEHRAYLNAKSRCRQPRMKYFQHYGGRGIEFRFESFEEFMTHIGPRPSSRHSLDRIDNNGHYEIGNVKWSTRVEQANNRRNTVLLSHNGLTLTLAEWSQKLGVPETLIYDRLRKDWCVSCALTLPLRGVCIHKT